MYGAPEPDELVVNFDLAKDAPFEISTASPAYRTAEGLGVGSAATAIRAALGPPLCESGDGDGPMVYGAIWFLTSHGNVTRDFHPQKIKSRRLPDRAGAVPVSGHTQSRHIRQVDRNAPGRSSRSRLRGG